MKYVYLVIDEEGLVKGVWTERNNAEQFILDWLPYPQMPRCYIEEYPLNEES